MAVSVVDPMLFLPFHGTSVVLWYQMLIIGGRMITAINGELRKKHNH